MSWRQSLIRISTYEVELLQKRLSDIVDRRWALEMRIASLDAETEAEIIHARTNAEAGIYLVGFRQGVRIRRDLLEADLASLAIEEEGARDALSEAFEALKKFEHVAEAAKVAQRVETAKRETAALDELGLRLSLAVTLAATRRAAIGGALALAACGPAAKSAPATPIVDTPLKYLAPFPIGCAVMTGRLTEPAFADLLSRHVSQLTPEWEMKMEYICQDDGALRFDAPDTIAAFARAHGQRLHGHALVWYANEPKAFTELDTRRAGFADAYRNYIAAVVARYRGQAAGWDVVNEPVVDDNSGALRQSLWSRRLGDIDHIRLALDHARQADPTAVLFINDYNLELYPKKRAAFLKLAEALLKAGAPLGGLGTQTHLAADLPAGAVAATIRDLASLGLKLHVSEMDVSVAWAKGLSRSATQQRQAELYAEATQALCALPAAQRYALTLWGLRDSDSWHRKDQPSDTPLLFDDRGAAKPAFAAVAGALRASR